MIYLRKIYQKEFFRQSVVYLLFLYVVLLSSKELFHNHDNTFFEPDNCPVYNFIASSEAQDPAVNEFNLIISTCEIQQPQSFPLFLQGIFNTKSPRSPPPF